jgi:hypothetical protein
MCISVHDDLKIAISKNNNASYEKLWSYAVLEMEGRFYICIE